jgi:hypothetical protein
MARASLRRQTGANHGCGLRATERQIRSTSIIMANGSADILCLQAATKDAFGSASGPMWEVDTAFEGRMPLGVGTTPAGTAITVATNYGNDQVTLAEMNLPEHYHYVARSTQQNSSSISATQTMAYIGGGYGNENYVLQGLDVASNPANVGQTSAFGEASPTAVTTLGPSRGVYFIKRTARVFFIPE